MRVMNAWGIPRQEGGRLRPPAQDREVGTGIRNMVEGEAGGRQRRCKRGGNSTKPVQIIVILFAFWLRHTFIAYTVS